MSFGSFRLEIFWISGMTDVRILSEAEARSVQLLKNRQLTLSLDKKLDDSVSLGITKTLATKYPEFGPDG